MRPEVLAEYLGTTIRSLFVPIVQRVAAVCDQVKSLEDRAPVPGPPGPAGADGKDGLGFDDYSVTYDGERTFTHIWTKGDQRKELSFQVPVPIYRGWFVRDKHYAPGDRVTCNNGEFHCNAGTTRAPGDGSKDWTLVVKSGKR